MVMMIKRDDCAKQLMTMLLPVSVVEYGPRLVKPVDVQILLFETQLFVEILLWFVIYLLLQRQR